MNPPVTITQIADFFERLDRFKHAEAEEFMARFTAFKPGFEEANNASKLAMRQTAPKFNIFRALKIQRSEKFHSDFIAYLLDPNESHAQGYLFLQTFFELLKPDYPALPLPIASLSHNGWLVQREVFFSDADGSGRIDIVLRNHAFKALYVIENKVDAGEQDEQVYRYATYLKRQAKEYPNHGVLFLTLDGHPSLTAKGEPHHPIAYHTHIRAWLEHALPEIEAATVRETVNQYLSIIQGFKEG